MKDEVKLTFDVVARLVTEPEPATTAAGAT
jgi:hypothetical protein